MTEFAENFRSPGIWAD